MKKSMKQLVLVVSVLAVLGAGFHYAYAAIGDESSVTSLNPFLKRGYARLELTDQQISAIRAIVKKYAPELKAMTHQRVVERRALKALVRAESVNEPAIRAQVAKLAQLGADMAVRHAFIGREIRAVLTPEQLKKAENARLFREKMIDRRIAGVFKWFEE